MRAIFSLLTRSRFLGRLSTASPLASLKRKVDETGAAAASPEGLDSKKPKVEAGGDAATGAAEGSSAAGSGTGTGTGTNPAVLEVAVAGAGAKEPGTPSAAAATPQSGSAKNALSIRAILKIKPDTLQDTLPHVQQILGRREVSMSDMVPSGDSNDDEDGTAGASAGGMEGMEHKAHCEMCSVGGSLLMCSFCPRVYHLACVQPPLLGVPEGDWGCPACGGTDAATTRKKEEATKEEAAKEEAAKEEATKVLVKGEETAGAEMAGKGGEGKEEEAKEAKEGEAYRSVTLPVKGEMKGDVTMSTMSEAAVASGEQTAEVGQVEGTGGDRAKTVHVVEGQEELAKGSVVGKAEGTTEGTIEGTTEAEGQAVGAAVGVAAVTIPAASIPAGTPKKLEESRVEYYVKWRSLPHAHCGWVSEQRMLRDAKSAKLLQTFVRNYVKNHKAALQEATMTFAERGDEADAARLKLRKEREQVVLPRELEEEPFPPTWGECDRVVAMELVPETSLHVGDLVEAKWYTGKAYTRKWYIGTIVKVNPSTPLDRAAGYSHSYAIMFHDGSNWDAAPSFVVRKAFSRYFRGARVQVRFDSAPAPAPAPAVADPAVEGEAVAAAEPPKPPKPAPPEYFGGTIMHVDWDKLELQIHYDDGETEWSDFPDKDISLLEDLQEPITAGRKPAKKRARAKKVKPVETVKAMETVETVETVKAMEQPPLVKQESMESGMEVITESEDEEQAPVRGRVDDEVEGKSDEEGDRIVKSRDEYEEWEIARGEEDEEDDGDDDDDEDWGARKSKKSSTAGKKRGKRKGKGKAAGERRSKSKRSRKKALPDDFVDEDMESDGDDDDAPLVPAVRAGSRPSGRRAVSSGGREGADTSDEDDDDFAAMLERQEREEQAEPPREVSAALPPPDYDGGEMPKMRRQLLVKWVDQPYEMATWEDEAKLSMLAGEELVAEKVIAFQRREKTKPDRRKALIASWNRQQEEEKAKVAAAKNAVKTEGGGSESGSGSGSGSVAAGSEGGGVPDASEMEGGEKERVADDQWFLKDSPVFKNGMRLRQYQLEGVNWLLFQWHQRRSCILADEMGLGKTCQTVAALQLMMMKAAGSDVGGDRWEGSKGPFLVVQPLSTMAHWQRELSTWTGISSPPLSPPLFSPSPLHLLLLTSLLYPPHTHPHLSPPPPPQTSTW
jgi:hypothetical protein